MKRLIVLVLIACGCLAAALATYRAPAPESPALSRFVPAGGLLYLEAKDFATLVKDWNSSPQKQTWVHGSNYEVFSRSRLFLRLKDAGGEFSTAASLPPDMNFLTQVAGTQSALALY